MSGAVRTERTGRVAVLTIDFPPINAGGQAMRAALLAAVLELDTSGLVGVVLTGAGRNFVGGADIREFDLAPLEPHLPEVIAAIEDCPLPVLALIDGAALGGGYEIALGCDFRLATPRALVGLPEVTLGLIPGAGGTLRLQRLVGQARGIELICSGRRVKAVEALAMGMVDAIADRGDPLAEAVARLEAGVRKRRLREVAVPPEDEAAVSEAETAALKAARGADAVPAAIVAIRDSATLPVEEALRREREASLRLRRAPQSRALRYLFFAERHAGRLPDSPAEGAPISSTAVVGGGRMGQGVAVALARAGVETLLVEVDSARAEAALAGVRETLEELERRGQVDAGEIAGRIRTGALADAAGAELVIEAIIEEMDAKTALFRDLEAIVQPGTILASNTSYLDLDAIAATLERPERFAGMHFFNPAHVMRLVEVVRTARAGPETLARLVALARRLRKVPVIAGVGEGFIGNRIFAAYREQCEFLLEEGALPQEVDAAMQSFGMAMGPFAVFDLAGLDIAWARRKRLAPQRDPEARYVPVADWLCEAGRFGRRAGKGWYDYSATPRGAPDPEVERLIRRAAHESGREQRAFSPEEISTRLVATMADTAAQLLGESIAAAPSDVDVVMVNGYGFPRLKGGPLFWASQNEACVMAALEEVVAASGKGHAVAPNLPQVLAEVRGEQDGSIR